MNFMNIRSSLGVTIGIILVAALVATTTTTALESQYADAIGLPYQVTIYTSHGGLTRQEMMK